MRVRLSPGAGGIMAVVCTRIVVRVLALALVVLPLAACSDTRLSPTYSPQGILTDPWHSAPPVDLNVVDHIRNTAPLAPSSFLGIQRTAPGAQIICDGCAYYIVSPPVELVKGIVTDTLVRQGVPLSGSANKKIRVEILQFEFFVPKASAGRDLVLEGRVRLRVTVTGTGGVIADTNYMEASEFSFGKIGESNDMQEWVSRTVSAAVEHTLSDPQVSAALGGS
jgi:hypothetical protein